MSKLHLEKYSINFSSSNRDEQMDRSPLNFTVWLNDEKSKSSIYRSFKNIKKINFEHVNFPSYIQLHKFKVSDNDPSYNDIITALSTLSPVVDKQLILNSNTYEICNIFTNNMTSINFTINGNKNICYEYINNLNVISVYKYCPISIDSAGNRIQFLSIHPCDNTQIYTTKNKNIFKYLFPKLKSGSDLYLFSRKSTIIYPDNNTLQMKKLVIKLLDLQSEPIVINNLDYSTNAYSTLMLNEEPKYSHPNYYLRHPFNPKFQLDIFMSIECFEKHLILNTVFF